MTTNSTYKRWKSVGFAPWHLFWDADGDPIDFGDAFIRTIDSIAAAFGESS